MRPSDDTASLKGNRGDYSPEGEAKVGRALFGALGDAPHIPGGRNGFMQCPTCGQHTPDAWQFLSVDSRLGRTGIEREIALEAPQEHAKTVTLDWMRCANDECLELVIRIHESYPTLQRGTPIQVTTAAWIARPRASTGRPVAPSIPPELKKDYEDAAAILDITPRMSAVLSRRLLYDLLERYAGIAEGTLKGSIDKFIADTTHPSNLRENLHYLREMGNFGAHTQKDDQAQIIDVSKEEAEWTLNVIDRLFDYYIVSPETDKKLRAAIDKKLKDAGRKPIPPPGKGTP